MKKTYQLICASALLFAGCSDIVKQQPSDLAKYPELANFFNACGRFESGTADLDVGILTLQFVPSMTAEELFAKLDQIAESDQWAISKKSEAVHIYRKNLKRYQAQIKDDVVTVFYDNEKKTLEFDWR